MEDDELYYRAVFLDQADELREAGDLEFDFKAPDGVTETTLTAIAKATGLRFGF